MISLNCIAVDDEPLALELIAKKIGLIKELNLVQKCKNAEVAKQVLAGQKIDLVFSDIQMPGMSGIELAKLIKDDTMIIFTTAYEKYALEGFEVSAIDYLLKPIELERLRIACNKAIQRFELIQNSKPNDFINVKSEYQTIKLLLNDIIYVEGLKDYVKIYTTTLAKPLLSRQNLKTIESQLPKNSFHRIHKSYVVSTKKISSVTKLKVTIADKDFPLGETYRDSFLADYLKK